MLLTEVQPPDHPFSPPFPTAQSYPPPQDSQELSMPLPLGFNDNVSAYDVPAPVSTLKQTEYEMEQNEILIAVMGATGSGKTTFINTVSGSNLRIGTSLRSCTNAVQVAQPFQLDGRDVVLIDTPGFDDTTKSDTDILRMIAAFLAATYQNGSRLAGVIYIHRISDFRVGGIAKRNIRMFRELCGESTLKNVTIITNMWSEVSLEVGEAREKQLAMDELFFQPVLEKGAKMLRHDNTSASARTILRYFLDNHPLTLQIQRELVEEDKDISETAAGEALNQELMEQLKKHRAEMMKLHEDMRVALIKKDEESRREIEKDQRELQEAMDRIHEESQKLASAYLEEKAKLEAQMSKLAEDARREREDLAREHQEKIQALEASLQQSSYRSDSERQALVKQLEELKKKSFSRLRSGFFSRIGRSIDSFFGLD